MAVNLRSVEIINGERRAVEAFKTFEKEFSAENHEAQRHNNTYLEEPQ